MKKVLLGTWLALLIVSTVAQAQFKNAKMMCQAPNGAIIPLLASGTALDTTYIAPITMVGVDSNGYNHFVQCDVNGNLITSSGGSGTVGSGTTGQAAVYTGNGTTVAGGTLGIGGGGTGATTAAGALTNLGAQINLGATQTGAIGASGTATFPGTVAAGTAMFGNQVLSVPSGGSMRNPVQTDDAAHGATLNNPYWINQSTQDTYQLLDATTGQASWARLVPNYALPVDLIGSSIQGAYSVYKIRSAYAGNAMTIERASDSTTQALTFVNGYVDVVTATKFCLGTTCSVATWNDQSGNGYDCTQSTLANMPVFLIDTLGKGVTISFDGVNTQQYCNLPSGLAIANANLTMLVVAMPTSLANPEMEMFLNLGPVTGKETNLTLRQGLVSGITYNPPAVVFSDPWGIHGTTPADTGPAIYAAEQNSSTVTTWLNEHSTTATPTGNNQALTGGQIGTDLVYNTRYSGTISTVMIGNAALTAAQRTAAFNSLYKLHGISPQYEMNNWVALGDSTTAGTGTTGSDGWANLLQKQLTTRLLNDGIGGEWCSTINTNFATVNAPMFDPAARNNVLTLLCGIHDSGVGLAPAVYTLIQSIVSQARAARFTVAVGTLFDLNSESAYRLALNSLIRSGAAAGNYTVCDFGASAVMGQPGQNTNLAYFNSDQTHPTALGYAVMAQIARGCVEPLLER